MRAIKHTLTERWYSYEDALKIARQDPQYEKALQGIVEEDEYDEDAFEEDSERKAEGEEMFEDKKAESLSEQHPPPASRIVQEPPRQ